MRSSTVSRSRGLRHDDAKRTEDNLRVTVRDTGLGLPEGASARGSALRSSARSSRVSSVERSSGTGAMARATEVVIDIPLRWLER